MCGCEAHENDLKPCSCFCEEHDALWPDQKMLRSNVRRYYAYEVATNERLDVLENRLNAVNQLYDEDRATLSRIFHRLSGVENGLTEVSDSFQRLSVRMAGVEERLSPPDKVARMPHMTLHEDGSVEQHHPLKAPPVEDIAAFAEGRDLPPDMWDRFGVRWTAKRHKLSAGPRDILWESSGKGPSVQMFGEELEERGPFTLKSSSEYPLLPDPLWDRYGVKWTPVRVNGELRWDAVIDGEHERWSRKDLEDSRRGPFTLKSPLAEDQEPLPDVGEYKDAEEAAGEMLARLGTDAVKWAEDFVRSVSAHDDDYEVDQVLTWFANAIEAGRSAQVMSDVANADRIRLAKDALMSSGYFDEGQVDDEIAPRIRELINAHNSGFLKMQDDLNRQINKWKDRAVVAERRMSSVRQFVQDNLRVTQEEE